MWKAIALMLESPGAGVLLAHSLPLSSPAAERQVASLKAGRAVVFCLIDGGYSESIAACCSLFLAGADHVVLSARQDYILRLCESVTRVADKIISQNGSAWLNSLLAEHKIVAKSSAMLFAFRRVLRLSQVSDLPVLVTGETGVGKEIVARVLHVLDPVRSLGRFVPVNCATLNNDLAESHLFGHCKGAFTGANVERAGLFRLASGGILFLDEIGELSLTVQAKLLRVIQEKRLLRVGDEQELDVNVRIVAATNRDLAEMVRRNEFREDLYRRLHVVPIDVPPLRQRPEDIPTLVDHFLNKYRHLWPATEAPYAAPDFVTALQRADLPGNVRQLEAILIHALLSLEVAARTLELRHLPREVWENLAQKGHDVGAPRKPARLETRALDDYVLDCLTRNDWNLDRSLRQTESALIRAALELFKGNRTKAAQRLGITPRSLYNKLHSR